MKIYFYILLFYASLPNFLFSQAWVKYNNQDLFLSGVNLPWVSFANDIGSGHIDLKSFAEAMLSIHDNGGNVLRWWLHTNGTTSPEFSNSGFVSRPGKGTIEDLKKVLDIAWKREIGLKLCLWSFDMLKRSGDGALDSVTINRNLKLLTDTACTRKYIENCLIPMVDSLKGNPAIIAWEIFNEPEGMSNEFGWNFTVHVPMSAIQRFINLCAGAIHRTDPSALVTSGAWCFAMLSDIPVLSKRIPDISQFSSSEKLQIETTFKEKYNTSLTADKIIQHIQEVLQGQPLMNYYSDNRLIAAGGDTYGTLDFYSVHYYQDLGVNYSPFTHAASFWGLDKPIVVGEFSMTENHNNIPKEQLFEQLYKTGYAGALPWSWANNITSHADMLAAMKYMWNHYRSNVDVNGISGDFPIVTITNPKNNDQFPGNTSIVIEAEASDSDGTVKSVEFFASDSIKIGERDSLPYSITWTDIPAGIYTLTAVATDDRGNQRTSNRVQIVVGIPPFTRIEAERAAKIGDGLAIKSDPIASGGMYLEMRSSTGSVTWTLPNVPEAGNYEIRFGYRLSFDRPKRQYININGERIAELSFDSTMNVWLEKPMNVNLVKGINTIQMELSWGWMDLDYLAVPNTIIASAEKSEVLPITYSLQQNYPNPFNPVTSIKYSIPEKTFVDLEVFNILGERITVLVHEIQNPGDFIVQFNGNNLSSGVYYYRLRTEKFVKTGKMMLLR